MRFINKVCNLTKEEFLKRLEKYEAIDMPKPLNFFAEYEDPRIGIHVRTGSDRIMGYYEDGHYTRTEKLQSGKNYFWLKVLEKEGKTTVRGIVVFSPAFALIAFATFVFSLITITEERIPGFAFLVLIFCLLGGFVYKEQREICDIIYRLIE